MLGVGKQFPEYRLSAVVSTEQSKAFQTIDSSTHTGKWRVIFFWPMDFTFVCPTEIAAFGKLEQEFRRATRSCWARAQIPSTCIWRGGVTRKS